MNARKRRSDEVVAELLLAQLNTIRANLDGAIAGEDPEALHELRVAVRRSRTLLKGFPSVFAPADHTRFTNEFKELQTLTGPVRDHDVLLGLVAEFSGERPELASETAALRRELERQRGLARNKLKRRLTSQRFAKLLDGWQATLEGLDNEGAPIGKLAADRIVTDHEHLLALSAAALESGDPLAVHHARKRAKALRYKLEFFGRFGEKNETRSLIYKLKKMQDELGAYQDTIVQEEALREAVESADSVAVATSAGALIDRALGQRSEHLALFYRRFAKFEKKHSHGRVKRAFSRN